MSMVAILLLILKISIVLSVFAIGLKATFADVTYLFRRPARLVRALLSLNVLMPLFALALSYAFDLNQAVKIALVALAVSPIPPIFPNRAFKTGGTESYTIGLLAATAALSVILIPLTMEICEKLTGVQLAMRARSVFALVFMTVLLPLLIGIGVRRLAPKRGERIASPLAKIALGLLVVSALPVLIGMARPMLSLIGDGTILGLSAFALVACVVGHLLGGPEPANRTTLALATASRHPAVALAIAHTNFPDQKLAPPVIFMYLILSLVLSGVYLAWAKRQDVGHPAGETNHAIKA